MTADITPPPLPASCLLRVSGPGLATSPGLRSVWPSLQSPVSGFVTSDVRLGCCCCPESVCPGHNIHNIWTLLITSHTLIVSRQGGRSLCVTSQCLMSGSWPHLDNIIIVTFSLSPDAWYWLLVCFCYGILWISCRLNSIAMIQYDANVIIKNCWVFYISHNLIFTLIILWFYFIKSHNLSKTVVIRCQKLPKISKPIIKPLTSAFRQKNLAQFDFSVGGKSRFREGGQKECKIWSKVPRNGTKL